MSNARKRRIGGVRPSKSDILSNLGSDVQRIIAEEKTPKVDVGEPEPAVDYSLNEATKLNEKYSKVPIQDIAYVTANVNPLDWIEILDGFEMLNLLKDGQDVPSIEKQVSLYNISKENKSLSDLSNETWSDAVSYLASLSSPKNNSLKANFNLALEKESPWIGGYISKPQSSVAVGIIPSPARPEEEPKDLSVPMIDVPKNIQFDQSNNYNIIDPETGNEKGDIDFSPAAWDNAVNRLENYKN